MEKDKSPYLIRISGHSNDWNVYIKYYKISYIQKDKFSEECVILRDNDLNDVEIIELPYDIGKLNVKIHIISPDDKLLEPLNVILDIYKGDKVVDAKKISRGWDKSSLSVDLDYVF